MFKFNDDDSGQLPSALLFSIFHHAGLTAASRFGSASQAANAIFKRFLLEEKLVASCLINPSKLQLAKEEGINLNLPLLYRISRDNLYGFNQINSELDNVLWPLAALCGDITWLQKNESDIFDLKNSSGYSVAFLFCAGGHAELLHQHAGDYLQVLYQRDLEQLADGAESVESPEFTETITDLFYAAAASGFFNISDYLKKNFAKVIDSKNDRDETELHFACQYGDQDRAHRLVGQTRSVEAYKIENWEYMTPLHYCLKSSPIQVKLNGSFSIFTSVVGQDPTLIGETDAFNNSPLHIAAQFGAEKHFDMILECGVDPTLLNKFHYSALHLSGRSSWASFVALRAHYPESILTPSYLHKSLQQAADFSNLPFIRSFLLCYGKTEVNRVDESGQTIAFQLVLNKKYRPFFILVDDFDLDLNIKNERGETALMSGIGKCAQTERSDAEWQFISEQAIRFEHKLEETWFDQPNRQGLTARDRVVAARKESLFPSFFKKLEQNVGDLVNSQEEVEQHRQPKCVIC